MAKGKKIVGMRVFSYFKDLDNNMVYFKSDHSSQFKSIELGGAERQDRPGKHSMMKTSPAMVKRHIQDHRGSKAVYTCPTTLAPVPLWRSSFLKVEVREESPVLFQSSIFEITKTSSRVVLSRGEKMRYIREILRR